MVKIIEIINEEFIAPNECLAVIFADSKEELSSEYSVSGLPTGRTLAPGCKFKTADGSEGYLKSDGTIEWVVEPSDLPPVDSSDNGKVLVVEDGQWAVGESPVTPEDIQQAVDNYCEANFSEWAGGLDSGLTQPLMAAPADKVGELKSALTSFIAGKKISIIGDSIDTYDKVGYKIDGYRMYYPALGVDDVTKTWWWRVINGSGAELEVNAAYSGSRVTNTHPYAYPDFYDRVSVIGNPDAVFVTLGSNDSTNGVALGEYDFETAYADLSEATFRTAYIKGIKALQATYPYAQIFCITQKMNDNYKNSILTIANTLGCIFIDASDYVGSSGVHPGEFGMRQIASLVAHPTDSTLTQKHIPAESFSVGTVISNLESATNNTFNDVKSAITVANKSSQVIKIGALFSGRSTVNNAGNIVNNNARSMSQANLYTYGDIIKCNSADYKFKITEAIGGTNIYLTPDFVTEFVMPKASLTARVLVAKNDLSNFATDAEAEEAMANISIDYHMYEKNPVLNVRWNTTDDNKLGFYMYGSTAHGYMVFLLNAEVGDSIVFPSEYTSYISIIDSNGNLLVRSDTSNPKPIASDGYIIAMVKNTSTATFTNMEIQKILNEIRIIKNGDNLPVIGSGERPSFGNFGATVLYRLSTTYNPNNAVQAMSVYGNTLFQLYHAGMCAIYDLSSNERISDIVLDGMTDDDHCGNSCFGNAYFEVGDPYPAFYVSGNLVTYECKVEKVTTSGSELKQILDFSDFATGIYQGNGVELDLENQELVYIQRNGTFGTNILTLTFFDIPALTDGTPNADGIPVVTFTQADIKRTVQLQQNIIKYQDSVIKNGKIYILGGANPTTINVFDLTTGARTSYVDVTNAVMNLEPEGIDIYQNTLIFSTHNCSIYQLFF